MVRKREERKVDKQREMALFTPIGDMLFYHLTLKSAFCQFKLFLWWVMRPVCSLEKNILYHSVALLHLLLNHHVIKCIRNGFYNKIAVLSTGMISTKIYLLSN